MNPPFAPLQPSGAVLGDDVYTLLGEAILDGRLKAGQRLSDKDLAERLGVSRTPVREALQRLARAGLVEVAPNRYTRVSVLNEKLHADTHEFFFYLMGDALRIALKRCTDDALAHSLTHADLIIAASRADDHPAILKATSRFFEHIVIDTDNLAFVRVMRESEIAIRRNLSGWHPFVESPEVRTAAYEQFRDAVAQRDGARAEALLRELHGLV